MPPALHPRSGMTLSLFTTTLALSFAVVGLPHILPCPVPHNKRIYADGQGPPRRRKKTPQDGEVTALNAENHTDMGRECPVPKPGGLVGKVLGFEQKQREEGQPTIVRIEPMDQRIRKSRDVSEQKKS
jgi:cytochrome c oxidase assembly factor 2